MSDSEKAFHELEALLCAAGALMNAAEVHGLVCAMICRDAKQEAQDFFVALVRSEKKEHSDTDKRALDVFTQIDDYLNNLEFRFRLFLPDDESTLEQRMTAVTNWCQGFVQGMGEGHIARVQKNYGPEFGDLLACIQDISAVEMQASGDEEDEEALENLIDFLSLGVLNLYQELLEKKSEKHDGKETIH